MNRRLPEWLTRRVPRPAAVADLEGMLESAELNTVCRSARCPNLGECWSRRTATFMILGDTCTRNCGFCAIKTGRPGAPDPDEPSRVARTAAAMGLRHVVVTSVTRDDLVDKGAGQFVATISALRSLDPAVTVEVLTPDFAGRCELIQEVVDARPEIFNHNLETVARLSPTVRPQARYERSLLVLDTVKRLDAGMRTKSGIMLGLGETLDEVRQTMRDLRSVGVDALTIGQYLRPTQNHLPVVEYVHPEVFAGLASDGEAMGFAFVASSPFTRSSYNAAMFPPADGNVAPAAARGPI